MINDIFNNPVFQFVALLALFALLLQLSFLLEAKRKEAQDNTRDSKYDSLYWALDRAAETAVYAVEQLSRSGDVIKKERRDKAIEFVTALLEGQGYKNIPLESIIVAIEKAIYILFNKDKPPHPLTNK